MRHRIGSVLVLVALAAAARAHAQATVSGTLRLEEREDAERGDRRIAVVWLEPRGAVARPAADLPALRSATIAMRGREFIPKVRVVRVGGTVGFPNQDPFSHNVFSNVEHREFDLGLYRRGVTRAASFPKAGVHPIYCNIHSKMVSFVVAIPGAWYAQPDADGRFTIRDVPPGSYRLHAWHERGSAEVVREVTVGAGGLRDVDVGIDARAWVASTHLNKFGLPYAVIRTDRY